MLNEEILEARPGCSVLNEEIFESRLGCSVLNEEILESRPGGSGLNEEIKLSPPTSFSSLPPYSRVGTVEGQMRGSMIVGVGGSQEKEGEG